MNREQTHIATTLGAYGVRKADLRFTAHRVYFATTGAARRVAKHRESIERSLPGWQLDEVEVSRFASRTILQRVTTEEHDPDDQDEASEEVWSLQAHQVHPGMTIRLADRSRTDQLLSDWQTVARIKHERSGWLWFIGPTTRCWADGVPAPGSSADRNNLARPVSRPDGWTLPAAPRRTPCGTTSARSPANRGSE